jgi:hypothetical protein
MNCTPYTSANINSALAEMFSQFGVQTSQDARALTNIAVVGALINTSGELMSDDTVTIGRTLSELSQSGITVNPNPNFMFWNLLPPMRNNFLMATNSQNVSSESEAQLVIISALPKEGNKRKIEDIARTTYTDFRDAYSTRQVRSYGYEVLAVVDESHTEWGIWAKSCLNIGADIVVSRGGIVNEISSDQFVKGGFFSPVVLTHENYAYMPDLQIPGSLGFVVRPDYPSKIKDKLKTDHRLGANIQKLALRNVA